MSPNTKNRLASNLGDDPAPVASPTVQKDMRRRVRIILDDNDNIPPTGQFFGINGESYVLRCGEEALVPAGIVDILENAVEMHPVKDGTQRIVRWRNRYRFPWRMVDRPARVEA